jgi:MoaA/NifB/PqqE/SkfB family radical SAM enzyme
MRKPGSFDASVKGLKDLISHGIRAVVMFTISNVKLTRTPCDAN